MSDRWMTFDCYGTLLDWQTAFRRVFEPVAGARTDALVTAFHGVEPEVERELPGASYKAILREGVARAARRAGIDGVDGERIVTGWHTIEAFDDTVAALEELQRQGWKLGILTNCDNDLFAATRARLPVPIDEVVTAEEVGNYKPDLAHFTEFEKRTGVDRSDWVHAAVSYTHDMVPARALGLRRIWVDRERTGQDPSTVSARVASLAELVTVL